MQVKVLETTSCKNTDVIIPAGVVMNKVWDGRRGEYAGIIEDKLVSIPYDKGAIIIEYK